MKYEFKMRWAEWQFCCSAPCLCISTKPTACRRNQIASDICSTSTCCWILAYTISSGWILSPK